MPKYITEEEWFAYNWIEVTTLEDAQQRKKKYVKGIKNTTPPSDGYHYEDITTFGDIEQIWVRVEDVSGE